MQSCKVLLVDDEPLVIDAIKRSLHFESYEVLRAGISPAPTEEPCDNAVGAGFIPAQS